MTYHSFQAAATWTFSEGRSSSPMLSRAHFADLPKLLALAARDNVAVKISGACTLSREPFPYKDLWDPLGRVFDAFSFDRCMWGTDWTRAVGLLLTPRASPWRSAHSS
jgi:Amidohydrolase